MKNIKRRKMLPIPLAWIPSALALIPLTVIGITHLITLQSFSRTFLWALGHIEAVLFEYFVILFFAALAYASLGKLWAAFALPCTLLTALSLISHYKTVINGSPLVLRDLTLASQFSEIFSFAAPQITFSLHTLTSLVLLFAVGIGLFFLDRHVEKVKLLRSIMGGASALLVLIFLFTPLFQSWAISLDKLPMSEEERIKEYGTALGLYSTYSHNKKEMEIYASASVDELLSQVESLENGSGEAKETPNVIFLMSESFFDVTKLPYVSFSEDPIPIFRSLAEKHTSGDFISNTYCGGTGYVEMEVLTGICSNLLRDSDTLTSLAPNSVYEKIPTIADVFRAYGYRTSFLHSYNSNLYNREAIYTAFGFDDILFEDSFGADAEMRGGYISDMALSEKIISMYEEKGDSPMFMFALSMENHQPYTSDKFDGEMPIEIESDILSEADLGLLGSYVSGLYDADNALGRLTEYFEDAEEKVMIVFFGDHLPNLKVSEKDTVYSLLGYSSTSVTTDWQPQELEKMLSTDYLIWTNYEDEAEPDRTESSNMLGLSVLRRLGLELGDYYAWLDRFVAPYMLIYRPRLYVSASGESYSEIPEEHKEIMENYKTAVFDIVYGDGRIFNISRKKE